jgi:hypothetical protein
MRLGLFLSIAFCGCGFVGEAPYAGRRVADVSPWQDQGELTICEGTTRLAARPTEAAGACRTAAPPAACNTEAECRSREACVCGVCTVAICDSADECHGGRVCSFADRRCDRTCTADAECHAGERCIPGRNICRGSCEANADCQTGERCQTSSGLCVTDACRDDSTCFGGATCALERTPTTFGEPAPLKTAGGVALWFDRTDLDGTTRLWRAEGTDGLSFQLAPAQSIAVGRAPTLIDDGQGGLWVFYSRGGDIYRAHAAHDGADVALMDEILALEGADSPSVARLPDGTVALYCTRPGGDALHLYRATSSDGATFSAPTSVLDTAQLTDPVLWRNLDRVASPFVEVVRSATGKNVVRLWFAAHGQESAASLQFGMAADTPANFSIGEATSENGGSFTPYPFEPVFDRVTDFVTHQSELAPAVVDHGEARLLYYLRASRDGTIPGALAAARSPAEPPSD